MNDNQKVNFVSGTKHDWTKSNASVRQPSGLIRENSSIVANQVLKETHLSSSNLKGRKSNTNLMAQASSASVFYE